MPGSGIMTTSEELERGALRLSPHVRYLVDMHRVDEDVLVALASGALDERSARPSASGHLISTVGPVRVLWSREPSGRANILAMADETELQDA
jgi:hypothetical protein